MRKRILATIAGVSLTALMLPGAAQATPDLTTTAATPNVASTSPISWHTCSDSFLHSIGARCAKVSVPLDWSKPHGTQIKIAISRVKHTVSSSKYQGVVLVNPGGPGGSGLQMSYLGLAVPNYKGHAVGGAYDWIGFDPRGVGSSQPAVSCNPNYPGAGYNRPNYVPASSAYVATDPWPAMTNKYTDDCAANNSSGILSHLTTKDVAKDMNRIRQLLGASKISYYGFSYGTYLGQVYASLFPDRLRRAVFDGTVDPRGVWYGDNLDQDVAFDKNMNIWFGWLAKHDGTYHLGNTKTEVRTLFYQTRDDLYATPVDAPGGKLGGSEWNDSFLYAGYYQQTWTGLADVFAGFVNHNHVNALEDAYLNESGFGDDNGYAVYVGVQCTDTAWPTDWTKWYDDNTAINATAPYETWANAWFNEPCRHWPAPAHTPVKITGSKTKSLLMINEMLDAATPYPGSIEVRRLFKNASLVAEPGGTTHADSLNGNACVDTTIAHYLYSGYRPTRRDGNRADRYCNPLPQPKPGAAAMQKSAGAGRATDDAINKIRMKMQKFEVTR